MSQSFRRPLAYEDQQLGWNILRVPRTLPGTNIPHPGRTSAIFVVHGIGEQLWTATAAQLRSGFEDALFEIEKWQTEQGLRTPGGRDDVPLPPPFIVEGYWANYEDIEATFPKDWKRFSPSDRQFFSGLWQHRVFSIARTLGWFIGQQLRLLSPRVLREVGPFAWLLYFPLQLVSLVTLAVVLVRHPKLITGFLTDVRLYLDPRGVIERAIVQKIDERVGEDILKMIGLDWEFRPLPVDRFIEAAGERLTFDRVVWIAHSLGTVISYNVLSAVFHKAREIEAGTDDEQKRGVAIFRNRLSRFVTMGSPLDKVAFLFKEKSLRPWPEGARREFLMGGETLEKEAGAEKREWWINFYHVLDPVSGALQNPLICGDQPPSNHHIRSGFIPGLAHVAYWTDRTALRFILSRTYGKNYLHDKEFRPWPPWVLTLLAVLGYVTWAAILVGAVYGFYRWGPTILRALGEKALGWLTG